MKLTFALILLVNNTNKASPMNPSYEPKKSCKSVSFLII